MNILKSLCIFVLLLEVYGDFENYGIHPLPDCEAKWLSEGATLYRQYEQLIQFSFKESYAKGKPFVLPHSLILLGCVSDKSLDAKIFDPEETFSTATHADVWGVSLPPMLESSQLASVTLRDITPTSVWGSCSHLTYLYIQRADLTKMPSDWLSNCTQLQLLIIESVSAAQAHAVLDTAPAVEELRLDNIFGVADVIKHPLFPASRGIEKHVKKFELRSFGGRPESLPENVTWAEVSEAWIWQISLLTELVELYIDFVGFDFCAVNQYPSVTLKRLAYLHLLDTETAHTCFKTRRVMPNLTEVRLVSNLYNELQFSELYSSKLPRFRVILDKNKSLGLQFTRDDYLALNNGSKRGHIAISGQGTIECDCGPSLWLTRAIREGLITELKVTCADGSSLFNQKCEMLKCDRLSCDGPCICCHDVAGTITVDCRHTDLYELPTEVLLLRNVSSLFAPNLTHLTTLPQYLPDSLMLLDLSGNNVLLNAHEDQLASLFQMTRQVRLAGNGVVCSCDKKPVLQILNEHSDQIEDYDKLTCVDDGRKLKDVNFRILCAKQDREKVTLNSVSGAFFLGAMALTIGVILYYKKEIQIFLFARGWCLCLVKEDELDADRRFDIFLSFCQEDMEFVLEQLLPTLDQEYSVCVHFRDWFPGEMILTQITNSIAQSRRTVVVVSRNFVKSLWGLLEFRTAYSSSLVEGRVRLVMVVVDDVLEGDQLKGEIRSYVRMNTYVKWGDPWFWNKLRYALPHNPRPTVFSGADASKRPEAEKVEFP